MRRLLLILAICGATVGSAVFLGAPRTLRPDVLPSAPSPALAPGGKRLVRADAWQLVSPGVSMRRFQTRADGLTIPIVALRVAPSRIRITTSNNAANGARSFNADEWRRKTGAIAAINGGFFTASGQSLGLRMSRGRETSALRAAEWGVFYVRRGSARILHTTDWKKRAGARRARKVLVADEAIQCGPRLVVSGKTIKLKPQWARRTGIGLQRDGQVVLAIADGEMSFQWWAALWASASGLNCRDALNLDGGGSTQIAVAPVNSSQENRVDVGGLWPVPDAVVIK